MGESNSVQSFINLKVSDIDIPYANIREVVVREWLFDPLPTVAVTMVGGEEWTQAMSLQENQELDLMFGSVPTEKREAAVKAKFFLRTWAVDKGQERIVMNLCGTLACAGLMTPASFVSYPMKTSAQVLTQIGKEFGFKADKFSAISIDLQTWLRCGLTGLQFVSHLLRNAWVGDDDMVFAWASRKSVWMVKTLKQIIIETKTPKILEYWPEGFSDDEDPKEMPDEDRKWPFAGFQWKDLHGITNLQGGYGEALYSYDGKAMSMEVLKSTGPKLSTMVTAAKDDLGRAVAVHFRELPPSAHTNQHKATLVRGRRMAEFSAGYAMIQMKPSPDVVVGEVVTLNFGTLNNAGTKDLVGGPYAGNYVIGGLIHQHVQGYSPKTFAMLFRPGTDLGTFDKKADAKHKSA